MTDPQTPPPWAKLITLAACVFAAVLWLPAVVKFDNDAKGWVEWVKKEAVEAGKEHLREGKPEGGAPTTTLPPEGAAILEGQDVINIIGDGIADINAAIAAAGRFRLEVEPLLRSDEGRLIATHPQLTAEFAEAYRRGRPSRGELELLHARLQALRAEPIETLGRRRAAAIQVREEAASERRAIEDALAAFRNVQREARNVGLVACLPLAEVIDDPWRVRRVCGPLPPRGRSPAPRGCCAPTWVW